MKIRNLYWTAAGIVNYHIFKKRKPLTVSFLSTYSCNQKCQYCDWTKMDLKMMETAQAIALINDFKKNGVVKLGFAGGESLHRKDIDQLLEYSHNSGLITSISSNGKEIYNHIDAISKYVDVVQLSLDGPKDVHDELRGYGSYDKVIEAIKLLRCKHIKVITNTVLTKKNIKDIDHVIKLAETYDFKALFQPIFYYEISETEDKIKDLRPSFFEMKNAMKYLIFRKKHSKHIGNSSAFFRYVQKSWMSSYRPKCYANNLFCVVDPLGYILPCCFDIQRNSLTNSLENGFKQAFINSASNQFSNICKGCYCNAYIESNLAFSFYPSACINALEII